MEFNNYSNYGQAVGSKDSMNCKFKRKANHNNMISSLQNKNTESFVNRFAKIGPRSICRLLESEKMFKYGLNSSEDIPDSENTSSLSDSDSPEKEYITPSKHMDQMSLQSNYKRISCSSHRFVAFSDMKQNSQNSFMEYRTSYRPSGSPSFSFRTTNFGDINCSPRVGCSLQKHSCMLTLENWEQSLQSMQEKLQQMLNRLSSSPMKQQCRGCDEQYIVQMQEICKELTQVRKEGLGRVKEVGNKTRALGKRFEGSPAVEVCLRRLAKMITMEGERVRKTMQGFAQKSMNYMNKTEENICGDNKMEKEPENNYNDVLKIKCNNTYKNSKIDEILRPNKFERDFIKPEQFIKEFSNTNSLNRASVNQINKKENNKLRNKFYLDSSNFSSKVSSFSKFNPSSPKIRISRKFPLSCLSDINIDEGIDTQDSFQSIFDIDALNTKEIKRTNPFKHQRNSKTGYRILLRPENEFYYKNGS